jgi:hypothetical protein
VETGRPRPPSGGASLLHSRQGPYLTG